MASTQSDLFTPYGLGPYELANRLVMAPMTRNRAGEGNAPRAMNATYYAQRASAGLIITEAAQIAEQGIGYPATPGIHTDAQVAGWRLATDAVHAAGGLIFCQLFHGGRISHPDLQPSGALPVAPSAIAAVGEAFTHEGPKPFVTPRALDSEEIPDIVEQFRDAAARAVEAEFDGVEIHAANGYLLDQFLRDGTNQRRDGYGGSVVNRVRLLREVVEAVGEVWGPERIGVRLSPLSAFNDIRDSNPEQTFTYAARILGELGLGYLHVVEEGFGAPGDAGPMFDLGAMRAAYPGTCMANGGYNRERGDRAIASGHADLISFGHLFLANPDLPERFRRRAALNEADVQTFYGGNEHGYTDYPSLGD